METRDIKRSSSKQRYWTIILSLGVKVGLAGGSKAWNMGYPTSTFSYWIRKSNGVSESPSATHFYPLTLQDAIASFQKTKSDSGFRLYNLIGHRVIHQS